jgi:putative flippase GtrA
MTREARFAAAMTAVTRRLPFGLAGVVAPNVVGYLVINLCTFFLDLMLLAVLHGTLRLPLAIAVTLSYGTAGVVSYVANRVLNFRSHGAVGRQLAVFVVIEAINYFIFVLGLTDGLAAAGVFYELARVIAACCEGVFLYCCMRWLVFRDAPRRGKTAAAPASAEEPTAAAASSHPASDWMPEP